MSNNFQKKPEKLASAVYLLTGFFDSQEPLKWKLRALAAELSAKSSSENPQLFYIRQLVSEIQSLLALAKNAGLIAEANHEIMTAEMANFMSVLPSPRVEQHLMAGPVEDGDKRAATQEPIKDKITERRPVEYIPSPSKPSVSGEKRYLGESDLVRSGMPQRPAGLREFGAVSVKKNNRKSVIIGLLKRKKEIMIKDVVPLIEGCSEKTVQRELLSMVKEGILKKEGEKRWSRYSLA